MMDVEGVSMKGLDWDGRHELIERTLVEHLTRALDATVEYDEATQSWLAYPGGGAMPLDVTEMATDINVGLGPPVGIAHSGRDNAPP